jgi:hypothetical protein
MKISQQPFPVKIMIDKKTTRECKEEQEEGVGRYWMTLRKGEDTVIRGRQLRCGPLALEEAWTCLKTDY